MSIYKCYYRDVYIIIKSTAQLKFPPNDKFLYLQPYDPDVNFFFRGGGGGVGVGWGAKSPIHAPYRMQSKLAPTVEGADIPIFGSM